ncbi:AUGMIN subunit 5-like isoform X3 [Hibiscus syriacus]|uniref:AUGMIN subunit 5-like isoform X3 n=1 Tax=Hibiscus syriacus TaxID=106335 RepID=UPI001922D1A9|nr:AUGMIN subunit 5-like isoform X3 [Hibiscus syriacus]
MQSSNVQPEVILEWLQKEMGYRPLGPYNSSSNKSNLPSIDSLRKICRGNMLPPWHFLLTRVKSEKTVQNIRKNITVHGGGGNSESGGNLGKDEGRSKGGGGRRKEKVAGAGGSGGGEGSGAAEIREAAIKERESAAKEVERLRHIVRRQRKDLKARMLEVSREEAERKRMLDERANYRYKYENNRVMDVSSQNVSSPLNYQLHGNGKIGMDDQLLERQKAHVQQFLATEDALNKAAEARDLCQTLIKRLQGGSSLVPSRTLVGAVTQNVGSLRQFELEVWAKEREAAGLKASLNTLMSEIQRLDKLCAERKEAEDSLRKKWKKIEEFDSRRSELESIYTALLKANMDAAAFWNQQPLSAREYASGTIIPVCNVVADISNSAKEYIVKEVSAFYRSPDNSLYMLPSTPQALLESVGANGSTGPEAVAAAEKNAALLTARAGARDPSAIPSICRVSAALQYPAGLDGSDAGLASVLESLEFCLKLRGSEASVLEELAKAINLVHIRQDLVESGHSLLNHAYCAQQEYARTTNYCLNLAAEQDKIVAEKWLPELRSAVLNAQKFLEDCKYVRGLLDEWWEQPASTVVDWVTVDRQNVGAWHSHVKQLLAFYDKEVL